MLAAHIRRCIHRAGKVIPRQVGAALDTALPVRGDKGGPGGATVEYQHRQHPSGVENRFHDCAPGRHRVAAGGFLSSRRGLAMAICD